MENGRVTGRVTGRVVDGARKAELLRELAEKKASARANHCRRRRLPTTCHAQHCGTGRAFRAKPLVRKSAKNAISTLGLDGILPLAGLSRPRHSGIAKAG